MRPLHWYTFLFTAGAASTALEIAGLRFLAPLFGTSLPVWGAAIATVIAGLALGYSHGGRRAREHTTVLTVVQYASAGAILFLSMPAVYNVAKAVPGSLALPFSFAILFLPSIVFGAVNPLAVQVEATRRGEAAGSVAGRISSLTTIGSLIGILLPSFITIPLIGTRETTWLFAGVVLLLALSTLLKQRRVFASVLILALAAALTSLIPAPRDPDTIFAAETPYQHVAVRQQNSTLALTFDATLGIQSVYTPETYTDGYWDYLAALPAFLPKENIRVLVLGAAASTTEHQLAKLWAGQKTFEFTSVELDGALFNIAEQYFDPPPRATIAADARAFAAKDTNQYDIIVVDAYARELTIPFHLATREFFATLSPRLAEGGILAVNANATSRDNIWIRSLARTMHKIFPHIRVASVPNSCNHEILASHAPWPASAEAPAVFDSLIPALENASPASGEGLLLTDNRAPTDWLGIFALVANQKTPGCGA